MKRTILIILLFSMLLLSITLVYAHGNFNETKKLIDSGISCDKLTNEQLEAIGDYYMEQMHPGEAHEMMHKMMGGEDSETTKLMHVNMAKSIYCGETNQGMMGMMNMMSTGDDNSGMMQNDMMNMMGGGNMMDSGGMMQGGMMNMRRGNMMTGDDIIDVENTNGSYGTYNLGFVVISWIIYILIIILITSIIYWLIKSANRKK